ncbi:MAG TPA: type II toxin-antitoxin system HicB family antitoxin [Caulobacteraceae bacterium]
MIEEVLPSDFLVCFPEFPEALTGAATRAEALVQAQDALETALRYYRREGLPLPAARGAGPGETPISVRL